MNGTKEIMDTAPNSDFDYTYLAWYAAVEHNMGRIPSGHRLMLTYNLMYTDEKYQRQPDALLEQKEEVPRALKRFGRAEPEYAHRDAQWPVAYMLEHKYKETYLCLNRLKGIDHSRAQVLKQACQKQGFDLYLANVEYIVEGSCQPIENYYGHYGDSEDEDEDNLHHTIDDVIERSLKLTIVVLPDGAVWQKDLEFEEESILQCEWYGDRTPDKEDFDGYYGQTTHYFRDTCLLMMPSDKRDDVLFQSIGSSAKATEILQSLAKDLRHAKSQASQDLARSRLAKFGKIALRSIWTPHEQVITIALLLDDPGLMRDIARAKSQYRRVEDKMFRKLGAALASDVSQPLLWKQAVAIAAEQTLEPRAIWEALSSVTAGFVERVAEQSRSRDDPSIAAMRDWTFSAFADSLAQPMHLTSKAGQDLFQIATKHKEKEAFLVKTIFPFVRKQTSKEGFVLAFLKILYENTVSTEKPATLNLELTSSFYRDIFPNLLHVLLTRANKSPEPPVKRSKSSNRGRRDGTFGGALETAMKIDDLSSFCRQMLVLGLHPEVQNILNDFAVKSNTDPETVHNVYMPFLKGLLPNIVSLARSKKDRYKQSIQTIIDNYIRLYVKKQPKRRYHPVVDPLGCRSCGICQSLDAFLRDPNQMVKRFAHAKVIRDHMSSQIANRITDKGGSPHTLIVEKRPIQRWE